MAKKKNLEGAPDWLANPTNSQHTEEIKEDLQRLARRHRIKYLIAIAANDDGLHSVALAPEPWMAQGLDRAVRQAVLGVGLTVREEMQHLAAAFAATTSKKQPVGADRSASKPRKRRRGK